MRISWHLHIRWIGIILRGRDIAGAEPPWATGEAIVLRGTGTRRRRFVNAKG